MAVSPAEDELGTIHGEVTYADGSPADGAIVDAFGDEAFTDFADEDGQYSIEVDQGEYIVQAFDEATGAASDEHEVTVDAGESVEVDLVIEEDDGEAPPPDEEVAIIEGVVTDEDGDPVSEALVQAIDDDTIFSEETEADGSYSLEVDPGTYEVSAFIEDSDEFSETVPVEVEAGDSVDVDLTIEDGDESPPDDDMATIEGSVTDEEGDPVEGAWVQAEGETFATEQTDSDGSYSLEIDPGTYEVSAFHEESGAFSDPVTIEVEAGETEPRDFELKSMEEDDFGESDYVADMSIEHVGGTAPSEMPELESFDAADGQIAIDLMDYSQEEWIQELSGLGIDETTEFEIVVEFTEFQPRAVVAVADDMDVEIDGSTMTVTAKPLDPQWIDGEPMINDWPEGDADQADFAFDSMLSLHVLNMDFPEDGFDPADHPMTGLTIATDAQSFTMPMYVEGEGDEPDALEIMIAGPHLTVDGETNEGIYRAFLPDGLLDEWDVDGPDELTAAYKGEQTSFEATEVDGGILIEIDVSYSAGTVGISPAQTSETPTPTPGGGDEPTPTPTPGNGDEPTPTPTPGGDDPTATPTPADSDSIPGPGIIGTITAILGTGYLLRRRFDSRSR